MNMYFVVISPSVVGEMVAFPFLTTNDTLLAFVDGWWPCGFATLGIATLMLWASFDPRRYLGAVRLEFMPGVLDELYRSVRVYETRDDLVFMVIPLGLIVAGVWFARQAKAASAWTRSAASQGGAHEMVL